MGEMKKYVVTVIIDASVGVEVEALNKEDAYQKAIEQIDTPSLCHHCASEIDLGDIIEEPIGVNTKMLVTELD